MSDVGDALPDDLLPTLQPTVEHRWFGRYGVVGEPEGGSYLRLEPIEYEFTTSLDGSASVETLEAKSGPDAHDWLELLWEEGFLVGSPGPSTDRVVFTPQGIEISGVQRLVRWAYRWFGRWVFTVGGRIAVAVVALIGVVVFAQALATGLPLRPTTLSPIVAVVVIEVMTWSGAFLHEFGHAFVLVRHGRRVGRVGVGFYWGLLSFYVDASDGMLMDRRSRMWQAAAGCITEVFLAGAALLVSVACGTGTPTGALMRQFALLSYLTVLLNLVPLLGLDGYHLLTDALERPELKDEAGEAVRDLRRSLRDPRRRNLAIYGLVSAVFGVVVFLAALTAWWRVFGTLFFDLLHGSVVSKGVGIYFVLPYLVMIVHLAATARRAVQNRAGADGGAGDVEALAP